MVRGFDVKEEAKPRKFISSNDLYNFSNTFFSAIKNGKERCRGGGAPYLRWGAIFWYLSTKDRQNLHLRHPDLLTFLICNPVPLEQLAESMEAKWKFAIEGNHIAYFFLYDIFGFVYYSLGYDILTFYGVAIRPNST